MRGLKYRPYMENIYKSLFYFPEFKQFIYISFLTKYLYETASSPIEVNKVLSLKNVSIPHLTTPDFEPPYSTK